MSEFGSFYRNFGFSEYPFSDYSSESEGEKGEQLFVRTAMYGPIIEAFDNHRPMIVAGDRGTGKTAIIYDFVRRSTAQKKFTVNIDDYSSLGISPTIEDFYEFTIKNTCKALFNSIISDSYSVQALTLADKHALSYFLFHCLPQATLSAQKRKIDSIQMTRWSRFCRYIFSRLRIPINIGVGLGVNALSEVLARTLGTASPSQSTQYTEYVPEQKVDHASNFTAAEFSFDKLKELARLSEKLGKGRPVIIFDKIDEDPRLLNDSEQIAKFIEPLVTDTKFILENLLQVIVSMWVIPYNHLGGKIRTHKIFCPLIVWSATDLNEALNTRIRVYSGGAMSDAKSMFSDDVTYDDIEYLFYLANKNPRDLWHLLNYVMHEQFKIDQNSRVISKSAITSGCNTFVSSFDFYEYYPRRLRANSMDIYGYIKHLKKLPASEFTRNQLNSLAGTGGSTSNYVVGMESIGLVERSGTASGNTIYRIRDPKVVHAIKYGIEIGRVNT